MKKITMEKMEEHIKEINSIPEQTKKEYRKRILFNMILGIVFIIYTLAIIVGKYYLAEKSFTIIYKVLCINMLAIAIALIENAYKKDESILMLNAVEVLFVAFMTLFSKDILKKEELIKIKIFILGIATYYLIKSFIIYVRAKNKTISKNNDIKEIVKKESKDKLKHIMEEINKQNIVEEAHKEKRKRGRPKGSKNKKGGSKSK